MKIVWIGLGIGIMAAAVALVLWGWGGGQEPAGLLPETEPTAVDIDLPEIVAEDVVPVPAATVPAADRTGWNTYTSDRFKFSLSFPEGYSAQEYAEAGGAMSLTVAEPATGAGFQVYVTPYAKDYIDEAQIALDLPSGVMQEPVDILIDGVRATMFLSRNSIMGETREVWFINNGFLYEVVTYKQLDTWLGEVMQTWKFK